MTNKITAYDREAAFHHNEMELLSEMDRFGRQDLARHLFGDLFDLGQPSESPWLGSVGNLQTKYVCQGCTVVSLSASHDEILLSFSSTYGRV